MGILLLIKIMVNGYCQVQLLNNMFCASDNTVHTDSCTNVVQGIFVAGVQCDVCTNY